MKKIISKNKFTLILGSLLIYIALNLLISFVFTLFHFDVKLKSINIISQKFGIIYTLIISTIIAPLIEEFIFRYPLVNINKRLLLSIILGIIFSINKVYLFDFNVFNLTITLTILSFVIFFRDFLLNKINIHNISFISALLFGFYHIRMIENDNYFFLILALYIIPKIVLGIHLNLIRRKYGMKYNIAVHIFINTIGSISLILEIIGK